MTPQRDERGRWLKGSTGNPAGRPPREHEETYRRIMITKITPEKFGEMLDRQIARAMKGELPAFSFICRLLGLDIQRIEQDNTGDVVIRVVYERRAPDRTA